MSNPAKAKGTKWETDLVRYLRAQGIPARRAVQEGRYDVGDLHGLSPFVGQAKAWKDTTSALREGVAGAELQATHAGERFGVAFVKRARASTEGGYAVMSVGAWARLWQRLNEAETALAQADAERYAAHVDRHTRGV